MKKPTIIASTLVVLCFEVTFSSPSETQALQKSSPNSPSHSPTNSASQHPEQITISSDIDTVAIQPRDIITNALSPVLDYSLEGLYSLAGMVANRGNYLPPPKILPISQGTQGVQGNAQDAPTSGTIHHHGHTVGYGMNNDLAPLRNPKIAWFIPTQKPGWKVQVQGQNNQIFVNGYAKYYDDEQLKKGQVRIRIRNGGDIYVNNNLVMWKNPRVKFTLIVHSLDYENVSKFFLQIDPTGHLHYVDNIRTMFLHINYVHEAPDIVWL